MRTLTLTLTALTLLTASTPAQNILTEVGDYTGEYSEDNYFGGAMTMGDFDDNGKEEFVISAYGWNTDTGKNYFYQFEDSWPIEPYMTVQGDTICEKYGYSIGNLGDLNSDGVADLGIGLRGFSAGYGRLDIFLGSTEFDTIPDWIIGPEAIIDRYATDLDSCGDVNGDGYDDLALLVSYETDDYHRVEIHHGGVEMDSIPDWYKNFPYIPTRVSGLGDVNGDSLGDILVMGWMQPVEIYFGGSPMDTIPDLFLYDYAFEEIGGGVGDVNGDGYDDFCLPMALPDSVTPPSSVYFGGPDVDNIPDVFLQDWYGTGSASIYGMSCGDFNGDDYSDIASGTGTMYISPLVYIYLGGPWFNGVPDGWVTYGFPYYEYGKSIASGDVDGDGCDELLVAALNYPSFYIGRVWLYDGPEEWIDYGAPVEPEELQRYPGRFKLEQNHPNPFNSNTCIHFDLGKSSLVNLGIYNLRGDKIRDLITENEMFPGGYNVSWSGRNQFNQPVSSSIYILELRVDQFKKTRKMVLLR